MAGDADRLIKERDDARLLADQWRTVAADTQAAAARAEGRSAGLQETVDVLRQALADARVALEKVKLAEELAAVRAELRHCYQMQVERAAQPPHILLPQPNGASRA